MPSRSVSSAGCRRWLHPWGGAELPLFHQLLHMTAHLSQHKGQLFQYLKLMGREVGTAALRNGRV